jgi:hypothetical protein
VALKVSRPVRVPRVVSVRVDSQTAAELDKLAFERGAVASDVVRSIIAEALKAPSPIPVKRRLVPHGDLLAAILGELGSIGSRVRELARNAESIHSLDRNMLEQALEDLSQMSRLVRGVIGGLSDP